MNRKRAIVVAVVIAVVLIAAIALRPPREAPAEEVGFVLAIEGAWEDAGAHELALGQSVKGGRIRAKGERGRIVVALLDDTSKECGAPACKELELPATLDKAPGGTKRVFRAVRELFAEKPERFATAMSRGEGEAIPDMLLPIDGGRVDLAPLLAARPEGAHTLTVRPRGHGDEAAVEIDVDWNPGAQTASVGELTPGLHEVSIDPPGETAWVLALPPADYERARAEWTAAREASASLPPDARRTLLRAWLERLSPGTT